MAVRRLRTSHTALALVVCIGAVVALHGSGRQEPILPAGPLTFGAFTARFAGDGTVSITGEGWPPLKGTWKAAGTEVVFLFSDQASCAGPGRYAVQVDGTRLRFDLIADDCKLRRMIFDGGTWLPPGEKLPIPERRILRTGAERLLPLPRPRDARGGWPSFRGPRASGVADGQNLPDTWDGKTGANILWRVPVPGLAHSSPIVWGDRIFLTTAVSSRATATFRPGLYGDGDASDDRSPHRWIVYALDARTGRVVWERVAHEGEPLEKRHIKSTYASSTPATDGRIVVASFGSQGVHAYDVDGNFRWKVDVGRVDLGAFDIPSVEWGPASSPVIWNGLVILQYDTQADSFLLALDADTGKTVWKTVRDELPSWGTPTVVQTSAGEQLVTNASNFVRGYDPRTGRELWRTGRSSKITAPTPVAGEDLIVVASGRGPERPIFVVRPTARGDVTLPEGQTTSDAIAWSRTGRGSYMPTPLIYRGLLYVLANNGVLDVYALSTGEELSRERLPHLGSGFSASPIAADGRIYLSGEDGEIIVMTAGPKPEHIATNSMGELLMATPALADGVMYVRSVSSLFAVGRRNQD